MKRPMCVIGGSLAAATWLAFFFSPVQSLLLSLATAATGLLLAALYHIRGTRPFRLLSTVCFVASIALALHCSHELRRVEPFLAAEGEVVVVEGLVTDARNSTRTVRYTLSARFPQRSDLPSTTMTLRSYGEMDYIPGDVILCEAVLLPKAQPAYGLRRTGDTVLEGRIHGESSRLDEGFWFRRRVMSLQERMRSNLYSLLHTTSADVVSAMVLGMRDNVGPEIYSAVSRSGTAHLLSVSGLHLSILTGILLGALSRLGIPRRPRILLTIAGAFAFAVLVGFSASIIRAFFMTGITLAAGLGRRRPDALSALGFAVTVICLLWPGWLLGRGFWLSAGSTLGILLFSAPLTKALQARLSTGSRRRDRLVDRAAGSVAVSLAAYGTTLPLLVVFYGWVPLLSPLTNLLVAPFVPIVVAGGILCALLGRGLVLTRLIAGLTDGCTGVILSISRIMADLPFATISLDQTWMLIWLVFAGAVAVLVYRYRGRRLLATYAAALLVVSFSVGQVSHAAADRDRVELVTVADCDAAVLLRGREAVILGTPAYYEINGLIRYLEYRGVRQIRAVVAADCGEQVGSGLLRLCERYPVDCVIGPDDGYILGQLSLALPGVPVLSGGYADLRILGGARISVTVPEGDIQILTAKGAALKTTREYAIMEVDGKYPITLHPDGNTVLVGARGREPVPLGQMLYGETRYRL